MPIYKIGAVTSPMHGQSVEEPTFFAVLPFSGKMARPGMEGFNEILSEIARQFLEHGIEVDFTEAKRWMDQLVNKDEEFRRTEVEMKNSDLISASVTYLYTGSTEHIASLEELAAFIYSGPNF